MLLHQQVLAAHEPQPLLLLLPLHSCLLQTPQQGAPVTAQADQAELPNQLWSCHRHCQQQLHPWWRLMLMQHLLLLLGRPVLPKTAVSRQVRLLLTPEALCQLQQPGVQQQHCQLCCWCLPVRPPQPAPQLLLLCSLPQQQQQQQQQRQQLPPLLMMLLHAHLRQPLLHQQLPLLLLVVVAGWKLSQPSPQQVHLWQPLLHQQLQLPLLLLLVEMTMSQPPPPQPCCLRLPQPLLLPLLLVVAEVRPSLTPPLLVLPLELPAAARWTHSTGCCCCCGCKLWWYSLTGSNLWCHRRYCCCCQQ
jgi:hypothetical protein